jgi:hypothetical protein
MASKENHNPGLGEIRKNSTYSLREFKRRLGIGDAAIRQMKREGLPLRKIGKAKYVMGEDWFEFVDKHTDDNWKFEEK